MRPIFYFIVFSFIGMFVAEAQTPVLYKHSELKTYVVHYEQAARADQSVSNYIIRELARGNNKRLERTEYAFRFMYEVQLTRRANRLVANVDVRSFRFQGDFRFMGFDISDVLLPAQIEFTAQLEQGNKKIAQLHQRPVNINDEKNRFTLEYVDSLANDQNLKLIISDFTFHFNTRNRTNFNNKIALIDEYFKTDPSMQHAYAVLQSLDVYQLEHLRENQQHLQQINSLIARLHSRDFYNALNLRDNDPIAMVPKLNDIMALYNEQSKHMAYVMDNLHLLYYEKGLELQSNNPIRAREYFQASLQANNAFAPSMLAMARSHFKGNNINESVAWMRKAYQVRHRDDETNRGLSQLARDIEAQFINTATGFERQNRHQDALQSWEAAQEFCQSIPSFTCSDRIHQGMTRSHQNIYMGLYDQADRTSRQGDLRQAEQQVMQALEYQKRNARYVASADNAVRLLNDIKNRQYKNLVDLGRREIQQKSYRNAVVTLESALQIESAFRVDADRQLKALIREAKRPLLLAEIESAQAAVQRNQLQQARSLIQNAIEDISHYDFLADTEITSRLEAVRGQLQSQHCTNIQSLMEQLLGKANAFILEGNFLGAESQFEEIRYHQSINSSCGLSIQNAERRRAEVLPAIIYQQTLAETRQLVQEGKFADALDRYNQASGQFQQQGVQKFRLEHQPLHEFSKSFPHGFVLHTAGVLAHKGEGMNALNLLHHLNASRFPPKQMRSVQEVTGRVLARSDAASNPSSRPKTKVLEYTHGNKNLKYLRKAYVKQFKRSR